MLTGGFPKPRLGGFARPARGWMSSASRWLPPPPLRRFTRTEVVSWSPEALFAVVSDVDRYSEFVPLCTESRVLCARGPDAFDATLGMGYMGFAEAYTSRVTLRRPTSVVAEALDTQIFAHMRTEWTFAPETDGASGGLRGLCRTDQPRPGGDDVDESALANVTSGTAGRCRLSLQIEMQLQAHSHDQLLRTVMDAFAEQQVVAFKRRCGQLYGEGGRLLMHVSLGQLRDGSRGSGDGVVCPPNTGGGSAKEGSGVRPAVLPRPVAAAAAPSGGAPEPATSHASTTAHRVVVGGRGSDSLLHGVQIEPRWRAEVERAFEAHALSDALTLGRFVEACRALGCADGVLASYAKSGALGAIIQPAAATTTTASDRASSSAAEMVDARSLLAAALFVEFDADGDGLITRQPALPPWCPQPWWPSSHHQHRTASTAPPASHRQHRTPTAPLPTPQPHPHQARSSSHTCGCSPERRTTSAGPSSRGTPLPPRWDVLGRDPPAAARDSRVGDAGFCAMPPEHSVLVSLARGVERSVVCHQHTALCRRPGARASPLRSST